MKHIHPVMFTLLCLLYSPKFVAFLICTGLAFLGGIFVVKVRYSWNGLHNMYRCLDAGVV